MSRKDGAKNRKSRFQSEETMSPADVAGYLEGIAIGLRDGSIALGEQGESFQSAVAGDVEFEVAAKQGKKKSRVELKLAFRTAKDNSESKADEDEDVAELATTIPDEMSF